MSMFNAAESAILRQIIENGDKIYLPPKCFRGEYLEMAALLLPIVWNRDIKVGIDFDTSTEFINMNCDVQYYFMNYGVSSYRNASSHKDVLDANYKDETANKMLTAFIELPIWEEENKIKILTRSRQPSIEMVGRVFSTIIKQRAFADAFANNPLTKEEIAYLKALSSNSKTEIKKTIQSLIDSPDIKKALLTKQLKNFMNFDIAEEKQSLEYDIENQRRYVADWYENINRAYEHIRDAERQLAALLSGSDSIDARIAEVVDYISTQKNIQLTDYDERRGVMSVHIYTDMDMYDMDLIKSMIKNRNSVLYGHISQPSSNQDVAAEFWKRIFVDKLYKIQTVGKWDLYSTSRMMCHSQGMSDYDEKQNRMPNPHLFHFNCCRQTEDQMTENAAKRLYINNLTLAVNSTKIISFGDTTVLSRLATDLFKDNRKILRDKNGNLISAKELVKIIEEEITE